MKPLIVIFGATASGKTALSLALAQRFRGDILSCDSVAVYRGLELGTAKPAAAERALAPHHLLDLYDPDEVCTCGHCSTGCLPGRLATSVCGSCYGAGQSVEGSRIFTRPWRGWTRGPLP